MPLPFFLYLLLLGSYKYYYYCYYYCGGGGEGETVFGVVGGVGVVGDAGSVLGGGGAVGGGGPARVAISLDDFPFPLLILLRDHFLEGRPLHHFVHQIDLGGSTRID